MNTILSKENAQHIIKNFKDTTGCSILFNFNYYNNKELEKGLVIDLVAENLSKYYNNYAFLSLPDLVHICSNNNTGIHKFCDDLYSENHISILFIKKILNDLNMCTYKITYSLVDININHKYDRYTI